MTACSIGKDVCPVHGFVHGAEAEELRSGIDHIVAQMANDCTESRARARALQQLLDKIDARDSLAYLERNDDDEPLFYVQDTRSFVGNDVLWWRPDGAGYTTDIDDAGLFTAEQIAGMRPSDRAWSEDLVRAHMRRRVDIQDLRRTPEWEAPPVVGKVP